MRTNNLLKSRLLGAVLSISFASYTLAGAGEHGHHDRHDSSHHASGHHASDNHSMGHHKEKGHGVDHHGNSIAGEPGKASEIDRTVKVEAGDDMRFKMEELQIAPGETIQFEVTNTGKLKHEFSIGSQKEHKMHGVMMEKNPNMHHGPGGASITLMPGETKNIIWKFNKEQGLEFACNLPGHYQAGMHRKITFE